MKTFLARQVAVGGLLCAPFFAWAGPFDGTWKTQIDSIQFSPRPDVYELKDGSYRCESCVPPYTVKADGSDQPVREHNYYDAISIRVVDARTVQVNYKLAGRLIYEDKVVVSADGKTLDDNFLDHSGAKDAVFDQVSLRVAAGAPGAHAISGSWRLSKVPEASDVGITLTYQMSSDGLQMSSNGQSYDAHFDGKPVPVLNDPGKTTVTLKRLGERVIEETDWRGGKVNDVVRITVSADGGSLEVVDKDQLHDAVTTYTMKKQP
jgi:hypothetical protein